MDQNEKGGGDEKKTPKKGRDAQHPPPEQKEQQGSLKRAKTGEKITEKEGATSAYNRFCPKGGVPEIYLETEGNPGRSSTTLDGVETRRSGKRKVGEG